MRRLTLTILAALTLVSVSADEGMWMPHRSAEIYKQMRERGLKLPVEAIYNQQGTALCDAVVAMNGGMGSGSIISKDGLVITNHHVAYSDIQALSTPEHNYLEYGFSARNRSDELRTTMTVTFVVKTVEVTDEALAIKKQMIDEGRWGPMGNRRLTAELERKYGQGSEYQTAVWPMWRGEKYILYYLLTYSDVRLVAAPPVHIGAFGGETDNWSWPQHKCDFAIYRVYTSPDGKPADYSPFNVPLEPKKVLRVSQKGVHDNDFSMVIGFPGTTNRYMSSEAIEEKRDVRNPVVYDARRRRLDVIKHHSEADTVVRLKYSDKYFSLANYCDYARWENICLKRYAVEERRKQEERELQQWIDSDPVLKAQYGSLLDNMNRGYHLRQPAQRARVNFQESMFGISDAYLTAMRISSAMNRMERIGVESVESYNDPQLETIVGQLLKQQKDYDAKTDCELFATMLQYFTDHISDRTLWGESLNKGYDRFEGDMKAYACDVFANSFTADFDSFKNFFSTPRTLSQIEADPMVQIVRSLDIQAFSKAVEQAEKSVGVDVDALESEYKRLVYRFREAKGEKQYPDANSTIRLTYGNVGGLSPADAVTYMSRSTIEGYRQKCDQTSYDFSVDKRLMSLIESGDWGRWGEKTGRNSSQLYVNFITNNDITGGNSGSPVMNANGELIGLAFDGNRESMAGDCYFDPKVAKCVCVDIRFVMWCLEKYMDSKFLVDEIMS